MRVCVPKDEDVERRDETHYQQQRARSVGEVAALSLLLPGNVQLDAEAAGVPLRGVIGAVEQVGPQVRWKPVSTP